MIYWSGSSEDVLAWKVQNRLPKKQQQQQIKDANGKGIIGQMIYPLFFPFSLAFN